jgi:DNA-binding NarL/FixJ family response regulator
MKKRLLFVDDEPNVLNGLRRSLHTMRDEWDMEFVDSATAALAALEKQQYDAIISDMRMPVMDGVDLLDQVKQKYPDTVRMILSGQSSRGALFRSIAPAHQFLAKPCDPQELGGRLRQAFAMRDLLSNQSVKTVVSRLRSLPSLPTLYGEVMAELRREEPSFQQIAHHLQRCRDGDQNSTTRELRVHGDQCARVEPGPGADTDWIGQCPDAGTVGERVFTVRRQCPCGGASALDMGSQHRRIQTRTADRDL